MLNKSKLVQSISIGSRVAEEENKQLARYFVETENWRKVYDGESDIIFAPKGGGKSAIYSMLISRSDSLFDRNIVLATAENTRGSTVFADVTGEAPASEAEFIGLWKIYLLSVIAQKFIDFGIKNKSSSNLYAKLDAVGLLPQGGATLRQLMRRALEYVKSRFHPESTKTALTVDPATGLTTILSEVTFGEPSTEQRQQGAIHVDELFRLCNQALEEEGWSLWILLDRLDVAFSETHELEANALRALFRTYNDIQTFDNLKLKIFLRSDIWKSITLPGFREASHITRDLRIEWNESTLLRLAVQRLLNSDELVSFYGLNRDEVIASKQAQEDFFYKVFPQQVDQGSKKSSTFVWSLSRTKDGTNKNAPRELIHLLEEVRKSQLARFENGQAEETGAVIFEGQAFKDALPTVSKVRLEQTIYAEHPNLRDSIAAMEGQKTRHNSYSLSNVWNVHEEQAEKIASQLVEIGFFEPRGKDYWVPFLYRPALDLVQGAAEGVSQTDDDSE